MKCTERSKSAPGIAIACCIYATNAATKKSAVVYLSVYMPGKELFLVAKIYMNYPQEMDWLGYHILSLVYRIGQSAWHIVRTGDAAMQQYAAQSRVSSG
jgi:hypothetical protein